MQKQRLRLAAALLLGSAALAVPASAQGLLPAQGEIVSASDHPVPGLPGEMFGGSGTYSTGVMDESGKIFFRARFQGGGSNTTNDRGLFYGSTQGNLMLVIQGGDNAPTLPGLTLNSNTSGSQGLGSSARISPDGTMLWSSLLAGAGVTSADDSALFVGTPGSFSVLVREGDAAPASTAGATFSSSFSSLSQQSTGLNRGGRYLFKSRLLGGNVTSSADDDAWVTGSLGGAHDLAMREGDLVLGGTVGIGALGFVSQINDSDDMLLDATLSQTLGSTPATVADDKILFVWDSGTGSLDPIVREGDAAPGTVGATFNRTGDSWSVSVGASSFNNSGTTILQADLLNGDVVAGVNDRGVYTGTTAGMTLVIRSGDPAPGLALTYGLANNSNLRVNNNGDVAFQGTLNGATTTDDTGIWAGTPGSFVLVAREGDPAPGLSGGEVLGSSFGRSMHYNDLGQLLFDAPIIGGAGGNALYAYDPGFGVLLMAYSGGDTFETSPGVFDAVSSWGGVQFNNGAGSALTFGADGTFHMRFNFPGGRSAQVVSRVPSASTSVTYCTAGTTQSGCTASMASAGTASLSNAGPFTLSTTSVEGAVNGILFYSISGRNAAPWGSGSSFLCVKSPSQRTPVQGSGGSPNTCTGSFSLDWNAYVAANPGKAIHMALTVGTEVGGQAWFRDPGSAKNTSLSDALEWYVGP